jgi:hypothetical protein
MQAASLQNSPTFKPDSSFDGLPRGSRALSEHLKLFVKKLKLFWNFFWKTTTVTGMCKGQGKIGHFTSLMATVALCGQR